MPMFVNANEINHILNNSSNFPIENIDYFFLQNPEKKNVILTPKTFRVRFGLRTIIIQIFLKLCSEERP